MSKSGSLALLSLLAWGCFNNDRFNRAGYVPKIEPQSEASKQEYLKLAQEKRGRKRLKRKDSHE